MTQLADGRIAVAGRAYWAVSSTSWGDVAVAVLNPDGSRDAGCGGGDGVTYLDLGDHNDVARSIDVDAQGRIDRRLRGGVKCGAGQAAAGWKSRPAFGTDGFAVQSLGGSYENAYGIDVLADGRMPERRRTSAGTGERHRNCNHGATRV